MTYVIVNLGVVLIKGIKVCLFDAYGTLFDLHSAVQRYLPEVGPSAVALSESWRNKQLEYSWIRSAMAPPSDGWKDFWSLTQDALDFSMRRYGIENPALRLKLLDAYLTLDAFPEVRTVLESLKEAGLRTAIISNGTETMLRSAMSSARIESLIDEIVSADEVRVFKPSPKLYHRVVDRLEVEKEEVLFHSSNAWDAAAAGSFGFKVARIERSKQPKEYEFVPVSIECANLSGIPEAVAPR